MADHVFRNVDRDKLPTAVNRNRESNHLWNHGGSPRPGLDHRSILGFDSVLYLMQKMVIDEGSLF
jgi:hypothetical protein